MHLLSDNERWRFDNWDGRAFAEKNDLQNRVKRGIEDSGGKKKGSNEVQGFFTDVDGFRRKGKWVHKQMER